MIVSVLQSLGFNQLTYNGLQKVVSEFPQTNLSLLFLDAVQLLTLGNQFPFPAGYDKSDVVVAAGFQFAGPISGTPRQFVMLRDINLPQVGQRRFPALNSF